MAKRPCLPEEQLLRLAAERTNLWLVYLRITHKNGDYTPAVAYVTASSEKDALMKGGRFATLARPSLSTKEWRAILDEFGQPCSKARRRA